MKVQELRELSIDSLQEKIEELEATLFSLRFQAELGQLENPLKLRFTRKEIARVKTILNDKASA